MHAEPASPQAIERTPDEPSTPDEGTRQSESTQAVHLMIDYATRYGFLLGGLEMVAAGHTTAEAVLARAREKYGDPSGKKSPETAR